MMRALRILYAFGLVLFPVGPALANLQLGEVTASGENRISFYDNEISGPGAANSYLTQHGSFDDQLSLNADWSDSKGARWASQFQGRATNDPRNDPREVSLQRFSLDRYSSTRHIGLGDFYGSFTQYSFNQSLKGAQWQEEDLAGVKVDLMGGIVRGRWDDFWKRNPGTAVDRYVAGVQARKRLPLESEIGFYGVGSRDHRVPGSIADQSAENMAGVVWALPSNSDLAISGESSVSRVSMDHLSASGEIRWGAANRVSARSVVGRWRSQDDFENVTPDYVTTVGAASPDLRRVQTRNQIRLIPRLEFLLNDSWFRNNLAGQLSDTAKTHAPEAGLRWLSAFNRSSLTIDAKARRSQTTHSLSTVPRFTSLDENLSVSDRFGAVNMDVQYDHLTEERVGSQKDERNTFGINLSGFMRHGDMIFRPSAHYDLNRDRDLILAGTNLTTDESVGLAVDFTPDLSASANYTLSAANAINTDVAHHGTFDSRIGYNIGPADRVEVGYRYGWNTFSTNTKNYAESALLTSYVRKL